MKLKPRYLGYYEKKGFSNAATSPARLNSAYFMSMLFLIFLPLLLALGGCDSISPEISKDSMGNLEVYVNTPPGIEAHPAKIYVDDIFVGNVSERLPVLYLKRGQHMIRVELAGLKNYQQAITILGEPNHQFLYVPLRP